MKKKPDLMLVLSLTFILGLLVTGYAQSFFLT